MCVIKWPQPHLKRSNLLRQNLDRTAFFNSPSKRIEVEDAQKQKS